MPLVRIFHRLQAPSADARGEEYADGACNGHASGVGNVALTESFLGGSSAGGGSDPTAAVPVDEGGCQGAPVGQRSWSLGASEAWIALMTGYSCDDGPERALHIAPFDAATDAVAGPWKTTPVTALVPCTSGQMVVLSGDVLFTGGLSTRVVDAAPGDWLAATVLESAHGTPLGWTVYGDVLVLFDLLQLTGPHPPGRVLATRVLW